MTPATAQKSPEAFRTISEVADDIEIPQHVLRFWETKFGCLKPLKRGGGRRYYRPDDVDLLRGIRALLYRDGLTIKGVQKILREHGPRYVAEMGRGSGGFLQTLRLVDNGSDAETEIVRESAMPAAMETEIADTLGDDEIAPRARLEALLREMLALKSHLHDARARYR